MQRKLLLFFISALFLSVSEKSTSQVLPESNYLSAQPIPDRNLFFNISDTGVQKPITWGLDLAWLSETNIRRGIAFMGADRVDVVRASFQPTLPLVNGDLQTQQINDLNTRLNLIDLTGSKTQVMLNCDHPSVDSWYIGNAVNWAALIDATTRRVQERGRTVISVAPFNEPDFGWGQYTGQNGMSDFYNIADELRKNVRFDSIRISGGNTLNCDQASPWYNYLENRLEEGNTHQLAGSFDNYANFYKTVKANGDHGTNDELHNVMEAMVGVEYGLQTGIWWGTAEYARGEFVKASDGERLGYAEHRPNWTAASVYKNLNGKIQLFGGTSERQAVTTTYRFISKEKDVFFDGYGPQREYTMTLPGGTGYQTGQTNAERVVNVSWGDDIQPIVNGKYYLVNRNSSKVMEIAQESTASGANVWQNAFTGNPAQQWNVTPVDSRVGGDFSYFSIISAHSGKSLDIYNWSLFNAGNIVVWDDAKGANQQWYLEYAEDGWFYIRSRHSAKCIEVAYASLANGGNVAQWEKDGDKNQQWRFIPVGSAIEFDAPAVPVSLVATANAESVKLEWSANTETDLEGYNIYRSETAGGPYFTIARNVKTNSFVDNSTTINGQYFYVIKAVDKSLNRSPYSVEVSAITTGTPGLIAHLSFDDNLLDSTVNFNHGAPYGTIAYTDGKTGGKAVSLNGSNSFIQLPVNLFNQQDLTIATWIYWRGASAWQRIFDFGNGDSEYMFLTPNSASGQLRFTMRNGGAEQQLNTSSIPVGKWTHVAVTLGADAVRMYVNGNLVAESSTITIRPMDFKPVLNYIGRSQYPDPLFNGYLDDFRVYNYALTANEIAQISGVFSSLEDMRLNSERYIELSPIPAKDKLNIRYTSENNSLQSEIEIIAVSGKVVGKRFLNTTNDVIDVSTLSDGVYVLRLRNNKETLVKRFVINH